MEIKTGKIIKRQFKNCFFILNVIFFQFSLTSNVVAGSVLQDCADFDFSSAAYNLEILGEKQKQATNDEKSKLAFLDWRGSLGLFIQGGHALPWMFHIAGELSSADIYGLKFFVPSLDNVIICDVPLVLDEVNSKNIDDITNFLVDNIQEIFIANNTKFSDDAVSKFSKKIIGDLLELIVANVGGNGETELSVFNFDFKGAAIKIRIVFVRHQSDLSKLPDKQYQLFLLLQSLGRPLSDLNKDSASSRGSVSSELSGADKAVIAILAHSNPIDSWRSGLEYVKVLCSQK